LGHGEAGEENQGKKNQNDGNLFSMHAALLVKNLVINAVQMPTGDDKPAPPPFV
jgi:hypothetical protein